LFAEKARRVATALSREADWGHWFID